MICWGAEETVDRQDWGQADAPEGPFTQVSAGRQYSCGLRSDGALICWGRGELEVDPGTLGPVKFTQVSLGHSHVCIQYEWGEWGDFGNCGWENGSGQAESPGVWTTQVSAGGSHSCGLRPNGDVICWGAHLFPNLHISGERVRVSEASHPSVLAYGRIVARRLADGRTEFGFQPPPWQPDGDDRILPRSRFFPTNVGVGRWLQSSPVTVDDQEIGRISARLLADGRIEFALVPVEGERILPGSRYFPANAGVDRWLRSSVIEVE